LVEAIMLWNEPNNKSHWDFEIDPNWQIFARMINVAADCVKEVNPTLPCVLGGISPIDPNFIDTLEKQDVMNHLDVIAVHGFPLDWNHWTIHEWPDKLREMRVATDKPVWVSEVGVSTFGAEEVQEWGLQRTAELLGGKVERVHWYSLFDLPKSWPATTRHREAEGSAYYRHFYMGLVREDGCPKLAYKHFHKYTPQLGICQWFHYQDHRLDDGVRRLQDLGVKYIRTGLSWADYYRENALDWFDRQMKALEPFDITLTYCFTPEHKGLAPHYTSPPKDVHEFGEFCAEMTRRYARP
jgi:beta-xylosidase